ncbi:DUF4198 domain-containing protein [Thiopseudomonas denitrificans]|uniref:Uncharacterized protein DUF4198 n=1 Tax=Thiopseudomonas denitrificans TaxID=1501432 RepID=A0A4R6U0B0_9GAMM|nr:DUF4198 domain-containing protein [Thiopseudomonas denitrificans]TDQ36484.1 uncharacterized protein DUF4198 [Thiopseudomonas denitrificans]
MKTFTKLGLLTLATCLSFSAHAHRSWMLPSATILSGDAPWVTVDAAVSNDIFYFEHFPLQIEGVGQPFARPGAQQPPQAADGKPAPQPMQRPRASLQIQRPDGSLAQPQFGNTGRYRSTFDVELDQKGTWKLAIANQGLFASYELDGERKRWSGKLEDIKAAIPAKADKLQVTRSSSRMEVFVTSGAPSEQVLKPTGKGLELAPSTHPNDLVQGEAARFVFLLDGKQAANVKVTLIREGIRYRDTLDEIELTTNDQGEFSVDWPQAGMYWIEAVSSMPVKDDSPVTQRRDSYTATLEVMAP